jgi:hypothetical protein
MAYLGLFALKVAAQSFGFLVLLDAGPCRLEGGGKEVVFIAAGLETHGGWKD